MPKTVSSINKISGKLGEEVHVNSKRYGHHVRKAPKPGLKKDQEELKIQQGRNGFLNGLSGEICRTIEKDYPRFKWPNLYHRILKRLKNEKENNRFLLLSTLTGMELNNYYKTGHKMQRDISIVTNEDSINITIAVKMHPEAGPYHSNAYFFEFYLMTWDDTTAAPSTQKQRTDWIYLRGGKPEFVFDFPRSRETKHWLLLLRRRQGVDGKPIDAYVAEGIQVYEAGSFDEKDKEIIHKRQAEAIEKASRKKIRNPEEEVPVVKASRILQQATEDEIAYDRHLKERTK